MHSVALKSWQWYLLAVFAKLWVIYLSHFIEKKGNWIPLASPLLVPCLHFFLRGFLFFPFSFSFFFFLLLDGVLAMIFTFYSGRLKKQYPIFRLENWVLHLMVWLVWPSSQSGSHWRLYSDFWHGRGSLFSARTCFHFAPVDNNKQWLCNTPYSLGFYQF